VLKVTKAGGWGCRF